MLRTWIWPSVLGTLHSRLSVPDRGHERRYRSSLDRLEARVVLSTANEVWYPSTNPSQPFLYGAAGWVPVSFGNGTYAEVDTSGKNSVSPGNDVWYLSTNPSQPFGYGAAGWVPVGFSSGTYAAVDTSGDNSVAPGDDVWYFSSNPSSPVGFGGAGFVPISFGGNGFAAVDTGGDNSFAPGNDVWYTSSNQNQPFAYGAAGWVPVGFSNGNYAAVDTSGNNSVALNNDVWYLSSNPSQPYAYGAAGWVPLGFANGAYTVVNMSGTNGGVAPSTTTNKIWAGDALTAPTNSVSDVRGSWIVPAVSGSGNTNSATWVGIDGYGTQTVEQTGTEEETVNGVAQYYAWWEMFPNPETPLSTSSYPVRPGDLMTANVTYIGGGKFNLDLSDQTQGGALNWNFDTTQTAPSGSTATRSTAEWIQETPSSGAEPLPNFGTVTFSNMLVTISGVTLPVNTGNIDDQGNTNYLLSLSGPGGTAATSQLNSNGNGFSVAYGNSAPSTPSNGPDVRYYGPTRRQSVDLVKTSAARRSGVRDLISQSIAAARPAQAGRSNTGVFATVLDRKLPERVSHRSPRTSSGLLGA